MGSREHKLPKKRRRRILESACFLWNQCSGGNRAFIVFGVGIEKRIEENIVRHSPRLRAFTRIDLGAITKSIAELVLSPVPFVVEADGVHTKRRQRVKFLRLTNPIVVSIDPESQGRKDSITRINDAVAVAAVSRVIIDCQCRETVGMVRRRLWRMVPKELLPIVYESIGCG